MEEMAMEWSDGAEEFLLPDEFLDDNFFSEEEKAAVAASSQSDEECMAGLSCRLAGLLAADGFAAPPPKVCSPFFFRRFVVRSMCGFWCGSSWSLICSRQEDVMAQSPKSTLCGLPKSGQESPDGGASQGNSPPSSPLEQQPTDPWDLLYEAAGQVERLQVTHRNPYGLQDPGVFAPPARNTSPPPPPPMAGAPVPAGAYYHPFAHFVTQRQILAARVRFDSVAFSLLGVSYLKDLLLLNMYLMLDSFRFAVSSPKTAAAP